VLKKHDMLMERKTKTEGLNHLASST